MPVLLKWRQCKVVSGAIVYIQYLKPDLYVSYKNSLCVIFDLKPIKVVLATFPTSKLWWKNPSNLTTFAQFSKVQVKLPLPSNTDLK